MSEAVKTAKNIKERIIRKIGKCTEAAQSTVWRQQKLLTENVVNPVDNLFMTMRGPHPFSVSGNCSCSVQRQAKLLQMPLLT